MTGLAETGVENVSTPYLCKEGRDCSVTASKGGIGSYNNEPFLKKSMHGECHVSFSAGKADIFYWGKAPKNGSSLNDQ